MTMMETVASKIRSIMSLPDLRKKIIFTLIMCVVARVGTHIPTPGVDIESLQRHVDGNDILGFMNMFSGGAFSRISIFALGVMPYINASIVMQLLTVLVPALEEIQKEGDSGRQKISQWTRYLTIAVAIIQSIGIYVWLKQSGLIVMENQTLFVVTLIPILTAGTVFLMWLGEQITVNGIGNGISLLIFINIVARLPIATLQSAQTMQGDKFFLVKAAVIAVAAVVVIGFVVLISLGKRRIPIIYVGKGFGGKGAVGAQQYIPLKVNTAGVMPIIFASVIMMLPSFLLKAVPNTWEGYKYLSRMFESTSPVYLALYAAMVIFFAFFYTALMFDPEKVADNLKKGGGSIPGVRPGEETVVYLEKVVTRITWGGAVFLAILAIMPMIIFGMMKMPVYFGGTGLLIVVGVALDLVQQINAHLVMRDYDGFIS